MTGTLLCFGLGYSAEVLAARLAARGWTVRGTRRDEASCARMRGCGYRMLAYDGSAPLPDQALDGVTHVLTSVPPGADGDPVLRDHGEALQACGTLRWVGVLGSTAVYGDAGGAWVDESSPTRPTSARGERRLAAEEAWFASGLPVHLFRLAGIYGPGRSALDRLRAGVAQRVVKAGHVFSRIHVADIANVLEASIARPRPGTVWNVADDEPAGSDVVLAYAAELLGVPVPPAVPYEEADLSEMALSFYRDDKRVSNARIRTELGVDLAYPTYREGLAALLPQLR